MSLTGQVAVVTGGTRGTGAAITRRLAAEGCHVVVVYTGNEDAARDAVRFLLDERAGYVTGSVITVDGGLSMGD
ncbi:SDR family NAD(P)-dependent oxidoreductase [Yinghuangia sp. ASG 101]|uniref:SDR family NAD(P)-dependent oxidoreductase n=1 Tax=Yinghuangia sp. ASG 101 TaxID=2896848 RepID=UPI001E5AD1A5|nr:SDR family NAD(P)-dependent oxidoreductase [Yinghuangia sp. ASG 101]UGQ11213.1 SDR family NAD(P)-dependent oxidoreductase [Yinghuangia sp. ASG 101]